MATARSSIRFFNEVLRGQLVGGDAWSLTGDRRGGGDPRLAHTGSSAAMLGLLVAGLLSLLMAGSLLARRRRN